MPHHPDTVEGQQAHKEQQLEWARKHGGWCYDLREGIPRDEECCTCANINTIAEGLKMNDTGVGAEMKGKMSDKRTIRQEENGEDRI
jgi:hypothetical protein